MITPTGEIERFIEAVGHEAGDGDAVIKMIDALRPAPFTREDVDDGAGTVSTWWTYDSAGVQLRWTQRRLVCAFLRCQAVEAEAQCGYPRPLFQDFANSASRTDVERHLGEPDAAAPPGGSWIRYGLESVDLHLSFLDNHSLERVTVFSSDLAY